MNKTFQILEKLADPTWDPFLDQYQQHLNNLLAIISGINEPLEGSVFFRCAGQESSPIDPTLITKRRTLAFLAVTNQNIVEVGFNAGFSALLMLTANPNLKLTYFDICGHEYLSYCYDYLDRAFPGRLSLIPGDSKNTLPEYLSNNNSHDAYIIDGGHGMDNLSNDMQAVLTYANKNSLLLIDDTDFPALRMIVNYYMTRGQLTYLSDDLGCLNSTNQMLFLINS
jgi:predicted O-methyltransferase YrrM